MPCLSVFNAANSDSFIEPPVILLARIYHQNLTVGKKLVFCLTGSNALSFEPVRQASDLMPLPHVTLQVEALNDRKCFVFRHFSK